MSNTRIHVTNANVGKLQELIIVKDVENVCLKWIIIANGSIIV